MKKNQAIPIRGGQERVYYVDTQRRGRKYFRVIEGKASPVSRNQVNNFVKEGKLPSTLKGKIL